MHKYSVQRIGRDHTLLPDLAKLRFVDTAVDSRRRWRRGALIVVAGMAAVPLRESLAGRRATCVGDQTNNPTNEKQY